MVKNGSPEKKSGYAQENGVGLSVRGENHIYQHNTTAFIRNIFGVDHYYR